GLAREGVERAGVATRDGRVRLHAGSMRVRASRTRVWWSSSLRLFRTRRSAIWIAKVPTSARSSVRARRTSCATWALAASTSLVASRRARALRACSQSVAFLRRLGAEPLAELGCLPERALAERLRLRLRGADPLLH